MPRQRAGKRGELRDGQVFWPRGGIDTGFFQQGLATQSFQRLAQHLAALPESGRRDFLQVGQPRGRQRLRRSRQTGISEFVGRLI